MMMSVRFAIRRDVHELRMRAFLAERAGEAMREIFAAREQSLECDRARDWSVVEKNRDAFPGGQLADVRQRRIDRSLRLVRLQKRESDFFSARGFAGPRVAGRLRPPNTPPARV